VANKKPQREVLFGIGSVPDGYVVVCFVREGGRWTYLFNVSGIFPCPESATKAARLFNEKLKEGGQ
jgi:hypothetical protein